MRLWQATLSGDALAKGSGLPPARAVYALEALLCAVGRQAGTGATLLVDFGVGVLAARNRVMKFTFVQVLITCILDQSQEKWRRHYIITRSVIERARVGQTSFR